MLCDCPIEFERVDETHLAELAGLYVEVFSAPPWNEEWPVEAAETRLAEILGTPGSLGLLARADESNLAFVLGFFETYNDGRDFYLKEMCVAPSRQRQGLGTALLAELERRLALSGARKVYLLTARDSPAEAFYSRSGYYTSEKMAMMGRWLRPRD